MTESYIQSTIAKKLRKAGYLVSTRAAPNGWPDIRAFGPMARTILIEVKRPGKKPTELQELQMNKFKKLGYEVYLLDETKSITKIIKTPYYERINRPTA